MEKLLAYHCAHDKRSEICVRYNRLVASNEGVLPYDEPGMPVDACLNPWNYVAEGMPPDADDTNTESGVRQSIMYSLTTHNPKVCLTPDDLEAINVLYPRCDGLGSIACPAFAQPARMHHRFGPNAAGVDHHSVAAHLVPVLVPRPCSSV